MTAWQSNPFFEMFNYKVILKSPQIYTVPITVPDFLCTGMFFLIEMNSLASYSEAHGSTCSL